MDKVAMNWCLVIKTKHSLLCVDKGSYTKTIKSVTFILVYNWSTFLIHFDTTALTFLITFSKEATTPYHPQTVLVALVLG
jgi:hypothetical protein